MEIREYIHKWLRIIEGMNNDNTYKLAWGRAIVEACILNEYKELERDIVITHKTIVTNMLKYYWNQTFFFNLYQGPNKRKMPRMYQITNEVIDKYKEITKLNYPVWFDKAELILKEDEKYFDKTINKLITVANENVSYRFLNVGKEVIDVYRLDKENKKVYIPKDEIEALKDFGPILIQLLNYKWAQLLEQFNHTPKIASKVSGSQKNKIRRNNLDKYKNLLIKQFKEKPYDFYTGEILEENNISVDHVIPWSFMYSDDIWNLVLTSKSNNSAKSNSVPSEKAILKLKDRNDKLIELFKDMNITNKNYNELELAIENNLVDKYYVACRS